MESTQRLTLKRNDEGLKADVAQGLVGLRTSRGWTRKELAMLLFDVSPVNLQMWESQARLPRGMHLLRIARLLGLDLSAYPTDAIRSSGVLQAKRRAQLAGKRPTPVIDVASLIAMDRLRSGLTLKDFAARWGVPTSTVRNWEDGTLPKREKAEMVATQLGLPSSAIGII
jgi:DNA-binding transcriptional regulator YiaG